METVDSRLQQFKEDSAKKLENLTREIKNCEKMKQEAQAEEHTEKTLQGEYRMYATRASQESQAEQDEQANASYYKQQVSIEMQEAGWQSILNNFKRYVESF